MPLIHLIWMNFFISIDITHLDWSTVVGGFSGAANSFTDTIAKNAKLDSFDSIFTTLETSLISSHISFVSFTRKVSIQTN